MPNTAPKPFVFVLMPFSKEFDDIYQLGIKQACSNVGAYAERVDEQCFQESILDRVYNQIAKADIIISDMTDRNPNVFYETGYAHALGKTVILMTQKADDIPFDLKHYPHIIYKGRITDLIPEVEKRVKHLINQPNKKFIPEDIVEFHINGIQLSNQPTIKNMTKNEYVDRFKFKLDIHNPTIHRIQKQSFKIGLEASKRWGNCSSRGINLAEIELNAVKRPNDRILYLLDDNFTILPGGWDSRSMVLYVAHRGLDVDINHIESLTLHMFTEQGVYEYPFELVVEKIK